MFIEDKHLDPLDGMLFLAREFFIWLWWETDEGCRFMDDGDEIAVSFVDRMVMGPGSAAAALGCGGKLSMDFRDPSDRTEARAALAAGMEPIQVKLLLNRQTTVIEPDGSTTVAEAKWIFAMDNAFNFQRVVVPVIPLPPEDAGDAKAGLFEHLALLDTGESILRRLFRAFLRVRLDDDAWQTTAREISAWIGGLSHGYSREIQLSNNHALALFATEEFDRDDVGNRFCAINDAKEVLDRLVARARSIKDDDARAAVDAAEERQAARSSARARGVRGGARRGKTFAEDLAASFGMSGGVHVESSECIDENGVLRLKTTISPYADKAARTADILARAGANVGETDDR